MINNRTFRANKLTIALRFFVYRARWRENRTIFNTPNPRLMNVSLLRDNKPPPGAAGERRGSKSSTKTHSPSRQPSMASLKPQSPSLGQKPLSLSIYSFFVYSVEIINIVYHLYPCLSYYYAPPRTLIIYILSLFKFLITTHLHLDHCTTYTTRTSTIIMIPYIYI